MTWIDVCLSGGKQSKFPSSLERLARVGRGEKNQGMSLIISKYKVMYLGNITYNTISVLLVCVCVCVGKRLNFSVISDVKSVGLLWLMSVGYVASFTVPWAEIC